MAIIKLTRTATSASKSPTASSRFAVSPSVRAHVAERGTAVWTQTDPRFADVITDVVQGLYLAVDRFSEAGEGVLLQPPVYPPFFGAIQDLGREIIRNPLIYNQSGWH